MQKPEIRFDLQHFADGDEGEPGTDGQQGAGAQSASASGGKAQGKVWTDDYVAQLRDEAKNHRIAKKQYESMLRKVIGLSDDAVLDESAIAKFQTAQEAKVSEAFDKANKRLIQAELKAQPDVDVKLAERLMDWTKIKVDENGQVVGMKEALEALVVEFPQVKVKTGTGGSAGGANPPPNTKTQVDTLKEQLAKATRLDDRLMIKRQIDAIEAKG